MSDIAIRKKKNADAQAAFRARRANYIATLEETGLSLFNLRVRFTGAHSMQSLVSSLLFYSFKIRAVSHGQISLSCDKKMHVYAMNFANAKNSGGPFGRPGNQDKAPIPTICHRLQFLQVIPIRT